MIGRTALLAWMALAGQSASAFVPHHQAAARVPTVARATANEATVDVSIPYDAAARLAYDQWRQEYNKGDFDPKRYESFKANYNSITVANVAAKKKARETGDEPRLMSMNEYGDCTAEEYQAAQDSGESSTGGVLDKAMEAVESQSAASTALGDAAAALAEEEEKLAKKLGYDSVEELEVAMDTMEGIAEDGSELTDGLAREARIRSAYLQWCKDYGKEPDEARFPTFSSNFLAMEEYAAEARKEMSLNAYADMTEEEYLAATAQTEPAPAAPKAAPESAAKVKTEAEKKAEEAAAAKKMAEEEVKAKKEAEARKKAEASAEEARKEAEKDRSSRQAAQAKALEQVQLENEAAAIAAAREAAEREAAQVAQRRAIDEMAAEIARKKALEFEKKQKEIALEQQKAQKAKARAASAQTTESAPVLDLGSLFKSPEPKKKPQKFDVGSILKGSEPEKKKPAPILNLGSIFGDSEKTKKSVAKKPVAKKPVKKPKAVQPVDISNPVTDVFSSIFGVSKKKAAPSSAPKPSPMKAKPSLSIFRSPKPKAKETPAPAPASAKAKPTLSIFGSPKPKAKAPAPAPAPAKKKAGPAFSMFGSPKPKAKKPAPAPAPAKAKPTFSMFGSPKPKAKAPTPAPAPAPSKPKPSTSFFGGATSAKKAPVKTGRGRGTLEIPKKEKSNNFGFSFGGVKKEAESKDDIPVLRNFVQNPDGSLTGRVSNSKNYRNGTKITTSPVRRGVKAGQTVKTGSGSQYRLE